MRCRAMRRVKDISAEVVLYCYLEIEHAEELHYDELNGIEWRVKPNASVPAKPVAPMPLKYEYNPVSPFEPLVMLEVA